MSGAWGVGLRRKRRALGGRSDACLEGLGRMWVIGRQCRAFGVWVALGRGYRLGRARRPKEARDPASLPTLRPDGRADALLRPRGRSYTR